MIWAQTAINWLLSLPQSETAILFSGTSEWDCVLRAIFVSILQSSPGLGLKASTTVIKGMHYPVPTAVSLRYYLEPHNSILWLVWSCSNSNWNLSTKFVLHSTSSLMNTKMITKPFSWLISLFYFFLFSS